MTPQSVRSILVIGFLAAACADSQGKLDPSLDAGDSPAVCSGDGECRAGEVCLGGLCTAFGLPDASGGCRSDVDCPEGLLCAPSTGICVAGNVFDAGAPPDAGQGACVEGETRQCGSTKVGRCAWGVLTCRESRWPQDTTANCEGAVNPAAELCNGEDDDCNGLDDDGVAEADGDGFTACGTQTPTCCSWLASIGSSCIPGVGTDSRCVDCADDDASRHPGRAEACNGIDDDCNGLVPSDEVDSDGDSVRICAGDCNDAEALVRPGAPERCNGIDDDCDGAVPAGEADRDFDGVRVCGGDCDDSAATVRPLAPELCNGRDDDCDGLIPANEPDGDADGVRICAGDCDDTKANVKPGAAEACGGAVDLNCDGRILACGCKDTDSDGYVDASDSQPGCNGSDCNDANPLVHPGATEQCNGSDDNCNAQIDEGVALDRDADGFTSCGTRTPACCQLLSARGLACTPGSGIDARCVDCSDTDNLTRPGAPERCNGRDDDCDGAVPATEADGDVDGVRICSGDCDDTRASAKPGATELCNGLDDDCDGQVPATERDGDADTVRVCAGDCDDTKATVKPGALEQCNGIDDNCDGTVPANEKDTDGDGVRVCAGDCDDGKVAVKPGAPELCNGLDDNCDGAVPANEKDTDGDGVRVCSGDCDDTRPSVKPGAIEQCNGVDDDCDGITPTNERDGDGDSVRVCAGDCDDSKASVKPGATEACNGVDDDCDGVLPPTEADGDGDGVRACSGDCDDTKSSVKPGASELCNGVDDDCDGVVPVNERDGDTDGVRLCGGDCDDTRAGVKPGATEICNAIDDDCNGAVDDVTGGCAACADKDADGFTTCGTKNAGCCAFLGASCVVGAGTDARCSDCEDTDAAIRPGSSEVCNGKDDNCSGAVDEGFDRDNDGFTTCGTRTPACCAVAGCSSGDGLETVCLDCQDNEAAFNPAVKCDCAKGCVTASPGMPDGIDANCNGYVDETCNCSTLDRDRDGKTGCDGDCDDLDVTRFPGAAELCDCKDNDCNQNTTDNCGVSQPCNCTPGTDACRENLLCARDLATGRYACGSLCNTSLAGAGLKDGCEPNESCNSMLLNSLNNHLCGVTSSAGSLPAGAGCSKNDAVCKSKNCYDPGGNPANSYCTDFCGSNAYCGGGTVCRTVTYAGTPGTITGQCLKATVTKKTGDACTLNTECASNWCDPVSRKCGDVCCQSSDCPGGYSCADTGPSLNQSPYGMGYVGTCRAATAGNAGRRAGAACTKNADCLSEFCERTNVGAVGAGVCLEFCCHDGNCPNGSTCERQRIKKVDGNTYAGRVCVHMPVKGTPLVEQTP